jgi:hypothetical protein
MNPFENPSDTNAGDLPDIVDVVMEMGVVQTKVPSPAGASGKARGPRARLRRGGELGQHAPRLCLGLEAFCRLVPPPRL